MVLGDLVRSSNKFFIEEFVSSSLVSSPTADTHDGMVKT